jgi:hypothetical protein
MLHIVIISLALFSSILVFLTKKALKRIYNILMGSKIKNKNM